MGTGQPFKPLIVFGLAGVLVIATVAVATTRREQVDIWRRASPSSPTWVGERTTSYRNLVVDWIWHFSGARSWVAPVGIWFTDRLSDEPPMEAIQRRLRSDGHFKDGDEITCLQSFTPQPSLGIPAAYTASVLVMHRDAHKWGTYAVQIELPPRIERAVSAQ